MKIVWNKVTWYSKAIALALFVLIPFAAFWFGLEVGYIKGFVAGALEFSPRPGNMATVGTIPTSTTGK